MVLLDPRLYSPCAFSSQQMDSEFTSGPRQRHLEHDKSHPYHTERLAPTRASVQIERYTASDATDSILSGLTQLGAFRSGCRHAFTAIFEEDTPRVITYATTPSFASYKELREPEILVGTATLGLERQSSHRVIQDTTLEGVEIQTHPLVEQSQARFYTEVPLHDCYGTLIGTYGVLDVNSRDHFANHDLSVLYGVAQSISEHLDNNLARRWDASSKRKLDALITISEKKNDCKATEWGPRKSSSTSSCISPRSSVPNIERLNLLDTAGYNRRSGSVMDSGSSFLYSPSSERRHSASSGQSHEQQPRKSSDRTDKMVVVPEAPPIHPDTASMYTKASSLLQTGMDLDGVIFTNALRVQSRTNSRRSSCASFSELEANHGGVTHDRRSSGKLCDNLGSAFSQRYLANGQRKPSTTLDEEILRELFMAFPDGQVLDPIRNAGTTEPDYQPVMTRLSQALPGASSMIFLPIWNYDTSKWLAATIIWTCDSQRDFRDDDLHYLRVFGELLASEINKDDRRSVEKSKSDLLSSMSHELRSPLHGMLANSELLQSTDLDPAQRDMVRMVETCGETLLDTINTLLDFAKINNLTHSYKGSISTSAHLNSLTTEFDLGSLVEDVANSVYAGHRRLDEASKSAGCHPPEKADLIEIEVDSGPKTDDISVIVQINDLNDWKIRSISGAWRRIIMNILGNAFKFTRSGLIEIAVNQIQPKQHSRSPNFAHLTIADTGCGISKEYLDSKLFTPFSQESVLTEGVGLGLSITQQLVEYLGGHIRVNSELGVGTQIDVYIPVDFVEKVSLAEHVNQGGSSDTGVALSVCLIGMDHDVNGSDSRFPAMKGKISICKTISDIIFAQPGWKVSFADSLNNAAGDVAVIEESALRSAATNTCSSRFQTVVVLGEYGAFTPRSGTIDGARIIYIPQPFGPHKATQAFQSLAHSHQRSNYVRGPGKTSPLVLPLQNPTLSKAFDISKDLDSPPAVRNSVTEYTPSSLDGLLEAAIHVLIVDDNDINLKVLSTFMRKIGCTFETASDGLSALEKYKQSTQKFDYVLMDISMPVMDGITASSRIREYEEENELPRSAIMAVTGVASSDTQEQAFAAGMDEYLVKPLSLRDLKRMLRVP
ncbi:hypothetical protein BJX64DRAFT_269891 [Aspergillus heterothallicus]